MSDETLLRKRDMALRENLAIVGCDDESLSNMLKSLEQKISAE